MSYRLLVSLLIDILIVVLTASVILAVTVKWDSLQEHWEVSVHALLVIEITINGLLQITLSHSRAKVAKNMALTLLNRIFNKYTKYIVLCNIEGQNLYLFQIR